MKLSLLTSAAALAPVALASASSPAPRNDHQVTSLPNFPDHDKLTFAHFAGQLELDTSEKLFYWYAESQQDTAKDPIVLWLNGGPGCSSVSGMFTENGPFVVDKHLAIQLNAYAWNRKANVVWVESPAGVGFSGPEQAPDYYNDDVVADRLHQFLAKFLAKYPELKDRDFYITGESYAGMYIPYLVNTLVETPIAGLALKGFAIGNPLTDDEIDGNAYMDYYYYHALVSRQTYHKMLEACSNEIAQCTFSKSNCSVTCQAALDEGYTSAGHGHFNAYYIYGDVCQLSNGQGGALHYKSTPTHPTPTTHRGSVGPCADTFTLEYLNKPELQTAVHLPNHVEWQDCSPYVSQHFTRSSSSLPKYRNILGKGLKALIYSGDADSVVNFIGTERWITEDGLNLKEVGPWHAWYGADQQIAGYEQEYDGLTFKTIKGAGHMVPAIRPLHGLQLFECFVYGNETCQTFTYPVDAYEVDTGLAIEDVTSNSKTSGDVKKHDIVKGDVKDGDEKKKKKEKGVKKGDEKKAKDGKKGDEKDGKKSGEKKGKGDKKDNGDEKKHKGDKKGDDKKDKKHEDSGDAKDKKNDKSHKKGDDKKEKDKGHKKEDEKKDKGDTKQDEKKDKSDKKQDEKKDKGDKKLDEKKDKGDKKEKDVTKGEEKKKKHEDGKKDGSHEQFVAVRGAALNANAVVVDRGTASSSSVVLFVAGAAFAGVAFIVHKRTIQRRRDYERIPFGSLN